MSTSKRVAVVTGANKGIGLQLVKELCAKFDGIVYLTSRDVSRGKAAVAELNKLGLNPHYHQLDVDDESSVLRLRDHLKDSYGGIDILINNAGILIQFHKARGSPKDFADQAAVTMQTNFFSLLRCCTILFPLLRPHARVVNLSSDFGHLSQIYGQDAAAANLRAKLSSTELTEEELVALMHNFVESARNGVLIENGWPGITDDPYTTYKMSKVGLSALSRIQQREFDRDPRPDLIVNHVHPGDVDTEMNPAAPLTVEQGAVAPTWLALLPPNVDGPKGAYVWYDKQIVDWVNGPMPN